MSTESLTILLVEDDPNHAELMMLDLQEQPLRNTVSHVSDGEAALDYLFRRGHYASPEASPRPHLVLLDLRLPRVDGLEVLRKVKDSEELRQIPVVILTSSAADKDVATAYGRHANSYLVKPVNAQRFGRMMAEIVAYWLGCNHHPWS